jgi:hypothetical protein
LVSSKHIRVEVEPAGPLERAELTIHRDGPEELGVVADLREDAAGLQEVGQIDLVDCAVAEREPHPSAVERLGPCDGALVRV